MKTSKAKRETLTLGWRQPGAEPIAASPDLYVEIHETIEPKQQHLKVARPAVVEVDYDSVASNEAPAIFQTAMQAMHVAFVVLGHDPKQDSMLRKALVGMLDIMPYRTAEQDEWLEQLRGTSSGKINFGGLGASEVRAQCALVMLAIRTRLPAEELWAVQARYGQTGFIEVGKKRKKRYFFTEEKAAAINALTQWFAPTFKSISTDTLRALITRQYIDVDEVEISYRDIAHEYGLSKSALARWNERVRETLLPLVPSAARRLTPYFEQQGIVGNISERH